MFRCSWRKIDIHPDAARIKATLRNRDRKAAVGSIVCRTNDAIADPTNDKPFHCTLGVEMHRLGTSTDQRMHHFEIFAAIQTGRERPQQHDRKIGGRKQTATYALRIFDEADNTDDRSWINRASLGFVVQAHIAAGDRDVERSTCCADALDHLLELPHDFWPFRISGVQAIRRADWLGADARHIPRRFGDRQRCARERIQIAGATIAIHRHRKRPACPLDSNDAGAATRQANRVRPHHVIVLAVYPTLARDAR